MLGYRLTSRTTEAVTIEHGGKVWTYDVLAVLEFNSDRCAAHDLARSGAIMLSAALRF